MVFERSDHRGDVYYPFPKPGKDKAFERLMKTPPFFTRAAQKLPIDVLNMYVAHPVAVLLQHPQGIASPICQVPAIQAPAYQGRVSRIEQPARFGLRLHVSPHMI